MIKHRIVIDTNILISYALKPDSYLRQKLDKILENSQLLISQDTFNELKNVLERFVNKGYVNYKDFNDLLSSILEISEWIKIIKNVNSCRDPKDNKFLELAINGNAEFIITGDKDLLVMNPFKNTKILSLSNFEL